MIQNVTDHFSYVSKFSDLSLIQKEDINITIYERELPKSINSYLNHILNEGFRPLNVSLNINEFKNSFDNHFKELILKYKEEHQHLKKDIENLLFQFSEICNNNQLKIFFGIVDTDMCKRFHVDMYELRMLCTYKGQGTMWLSEDNINHEALNSFKENEEIVLNNEAVNQLNERDVAIIKGALYPNSKVGGLVHRSPAIENLKQKRIILRVDSNSLIDSI
ncbi:MAG: DUF1826 domain-containing protein [Vicingaceae bacterium]|nr:DUF1826 domain-containing protein [Vicingaceae bacterium]